MTLAEILAYLLGVITPLGAAGVLVALRKPLLGLLMRRKAVQALSHPSAALQEATPDLSRFTTDV